MTISRGAAWGEPGALEPGSPIVDDDRSASRLLEAALAAGHPLPEIGLVGGDLHRTLGSPDRGTDGLFEGSGTRFPLDIGEVCHDGDTEYFVAHLVAAEDRRQQLWRGRTIIVMNAAFLGDRNLGPRAHPNDGRLDVTDGSLPAGQRRAGRTRALTGSHLPHPDLSEQRVKAAEFSSDRPGEGLHLWLDGEYRGRTRRFTVRCLPDAITVVA